MGGVAVQSEQPAIVPDPSERNIDKLGWPGKIGRLIAVFRAIPLLKLIFSPPPQFASVPSVVKRAQMKKLRKIFSPNGWLSSSGSSGEGSGSRKRPGRHGKRRLNNETLEKRELLAGDIALNHNYHNQFDVDNNQSVTPYDALLVINTLRAQRNSASGEELSASQLQVGNQNVYPDVNADGQITPSDALAIVNGLRRGAGEEDNVPDLAEILLTARDNDDNELPLTNGVYEIDTNQIVNLEVSYDDLRRSRDEAGLFTLLTDLVIDPNNSGGFTPLLNETQQFAFDSDIFLFENESRVDSITFGQEGSDTTFTVGFTDFLDDDVQAIEDAYAAFGFSDPSVFSISDDFIGDTSSGVGQREGYQIRFDNLRDTDIPDLTVTVNLNDSSFDPDTFVRSIDPTLPNGDPNPQAVALSIDFRSRTFNNNAEVYSFLIDVERSSFDPNLGLIEIGGTGPVLDELVDSNGDLILPFDAFSIPVVFTEAANNVSVSVRPANNPEAVVLYGDVPGAAPEDRAEVLAMNQILLDEDSVATFNIGGISATDPPVPGNATLSFQEDGAAQTVDLAAALTGGDPATGFALVSPADSTLGTFSITGDTFTFTPAADQFSTTDLEVVYSATNEGGSNNATITISVASVNDVPIAGDDSGVDLSTQMDTGLTIATSRLLANDSTGPANENETPEITLPVATTTQGGTVSISGSNISYTPATGYVGPDSFDYTLSDGTDTATATVSLTVTEVLLPPIAQDSAFEFNEDVAPQVNISLLLGGGPIDTLEVETQGSFVTASIGNSIAELVFTPDPDAFGVDEIVYRASNAAGSDTGTVTLTVNSVNDDPTAADDVAPAGTEDQSLMISEASLLANDSAGPDNEPQALTFDSVSATSAQGGTVTRSGGMITYTPAPDFNGVDTFTYTISDSEGATDTATVTVNVGDVVEAPITGDAAGTIDQGDSFSIDLLALNTGGPPDVLLITDSGGNSMAVLSGGTLTITPDASFFGITTITYRMTNAGGQDEGQITLTVNEVVVDPPPVVSQIRRTLNEEADPVTISLLEGSTDNGPLTVLNASLRGNTAGVSLSDDGSSVTINPGDYGSLVLGQTVVVNVDFEVSDGINDPVTSNARLVVVGFNDAPVARNDAFDGFSATPVVLDVLANDDAGDGEQQTLTITEATSDDGAVAINDDGTLTFMSNVDFTGTATINYTVDDGQDGGTASAVATVEIADFNPSVISGTVFQDSIINIEEYVAGAEPEFDGIHNGSDQAFASIPVRLTSAASENVTGQAINQVILTNVEGIYRFLDVAPGTYQVSVELPEGVLNESPTTSTVTIGSAGGENAAGPTVSRVELAPNSVLAIAGDLLSSDYLRRSGVDPEVSNFGREGATVAFDENGVQTILIAGEGFESVQFMELALNNDQDLALLTVVDEDGELLTAILDSAQFRVTRDGSAARFFGGLEDFTFLPQDTSDVEAIREDFAGYRQAVDQILGS